METFDFPYHLFSTDYPESGARMQLGNSYVFTTEPTAPDQRTFTLDFAAMKFFFLNGVLSPIPEAKINILALDLFYQRHKLWKSFIYEHQVYGNLTVKFNKPLKIPKGIPGGDGVVASFSVELIEMP